MESGSLLKNLVVFVPALNRYSAGRPCVCEMYLICKTEKDKKKHILQFHIRTDVLSGSLKMEADFNYSNRSIHGSQT